MTTLLIICIYVIGYIASYYTFRAVVKKAYGTWEWMDVKFALWMSLTSFLGVIMGIILLLQEIDLSEHFGDEPPKWL